MEERGPGEPSSSSPPPAEGKSVTPLGMGGAGAGVLALSALLGGGSYWYSTSKELAEEGIDSRARLRALPLAARALGISLVICGAGAVAAVGALTLFGVGGRPEARVVSWADAVAEARRQRDGIREELRQRIYGDGEGD